MNCHGRNGDLRVSFDVVKPADSLGLFTLQTSWLYPVIETL
jgi:hypothetical protein